MISNLKKNDTGLRVLEILKMLISSSMSGDELMKMIEKKDHIENIYTKETLLKYFNTMELVGLKVRKNRSDNNYYLETLPVEIELTKKDLETLCLLEGYVKKLYNKQIEENFNRFLEKLKKSFSQETKLLYETVKNDNTTKLQMEILCSASLITKFEKYCIEGQKLKIFYVNKSKQETELFTIEPKSLVYEDTKIYLFAYNPILAQNQKFLLENIIQSEQLPQRAAQNAFLQNIVFELKGSLAKSYKLKEGEKVINYGNDNIIVSNSLEDKSILFKRLLRYGENCKVLNPKDFQVEFEDLIKTMIANLNRDNNFLSQL